MACNNPLTAFQTPDGTIHFRETRDAANTLRLPCGQCIGCRLDRSRQWAIRCLHEAKLHEQNCFATLTYNDKNLPRTLQHRDFQLFAKKLRKKHKFRYYMCGEYGEQTARPHYHACLFGIDFTDKKHHSVNNGNTLYTSDELANTWGLGHAILGKITFESAAYVARYCMKKITGPRAQQHYERVDKETGEIYHLQPEYNKMSNRPGIGKNWIRKYYDDVYPNGTVISRGHEVKSPRYYDKYLELIDPDAYHELKLTREQEALDREKVDLDAREKINAAKLNLLPRDHT